MVTPVTRFADERLVVALRVFVASVNNRRMVTPAQTLTDLYAAQTASLRSERFIDDPVTRRHDPSRPLSAFNLRFRYAVFGTYVSHDLLKVSGVRRCGHSAPHCSAIAFAIPGQVNERLSHRHSPGGSL